MEPLEGGGSSGGDITIPSKKTVEEVWRQIQEGSKKKRKVNREPSPRPQSLPLIGEMTLEDFLVKYGVVARAPGGIRVDQIGNAIGFRPPPHANLLQLCDFRQKVQPSVATVDAGAVLNEAMGTAARPLSPGRKREAGEVGSDKMTDNRKKRMIKNRESAARSRARKQAYTNELENKICLLEAENGRLKKQKELASVVVVAQPELKYKLRRTRSATF